VKQAITFKFTGIIVNHQPKIPVYVEIPKTHKGAVIFFLIDSGATKSMITEKDAAVIGIDCYDFPECKQDSVGFGGTFKNRMINCPVKLTFGKGNSHEYCVHHDSGLRLIMIPPTVTGEDREKIIRHTPSVLGMDVIERFQLYLDKKKVELTVIDE
jgi:hypothetical protein